MDLSGKKLGLLLSTSPNHPNFTRGLRLAESALKRGVSVYLYCIDDAINGVSDPRVQELKSLGLKLYGCAYAAQHRKIDLSDTAVFAGLSVVNDIIASTDRFVSFN